MLKGIFMKGMPVLILLLCSLMPSLKAQQVDQYPSMPEDISPLLNGEKIPALMLRDMAGKSVDLNAEFMNKPTVLVVYRGGWCPFCNKQLSALQEAFPALKEMGYQLIAVSTDSPGNLKMTAEKDQLEYTLLSDADLHAAKSLGIAYMAPKAYHKLLPNSTGGLDKDLLLPVPSVFILDKKGVIHFEYINPDFKQRLDAGLLKTVAAGLYKDLM